MKTKDKTRRQLRYGKLVRGWDWRTTPELLERADKARERLNITKTELIERAIEKYIGDIITP